MTCLQPPRATLPPPVGLRQRAAASPCAGRTHPTGRTLFLVLVSIFLLSSPVFGEERLRPVSSDVTLDDVMARTNEMFAALPDPFGMRPQFFVDAGLYRTSFTGTLTRQGEEMRLTLDNVPRLIPREMAGNLQELQRLVQDFDLTLVGRSECGLYVCYVVDGEIRDLHVGRPRTVRLWIHPDTGLMEAFRLSYIWGSLKVDQSFGEIDDITVFRRQKVVWEQTNILLQIDYRHWWFHEPPADWNS